MVGGVEIVALHGGADPVNGAEEMKSIPHTRACERTELGAPRLAHISLLASAGTWGLVHRHWASLRVISFLLHGFLLGMSACVCCIAHAQGRLPLTSIPTRVTQDSAKFRNGDRISGTVRAIDGGKLLFSLDLVGETAAFPIEAISGLSFAGPPQDTKAEASTESIAAGTGAAATTTSKKSPTGTTPGSGSLFAPSPSEGLQLSDAIYLRDGTYLSATVTGVTAKELRALSTIRPSPVQTAEGERTRIPGALSAGAGTQLLSIPKDQVVGIGFCHRDDAVFQSDFSSRELVGIVPALGSWSVEKGQLVQASPVPFCRAYIPAVQVGMMRYEWTADLSESSIAGLAFYAERSDTRFGDLAYMATIRDDVLHFYKVIGEARHEGKRERINSSGPLVRFKVEYDPRNGEIVLWAGGDLLMRLVDPAPIQRGEYVLLHTEGKAAFDDVRVTHLVGTVKDASHDASSDTVVLSNGDRVSGQLVEIYDKIVLKNPYTSAETSIDRRKVRAVTFASLGATEKSPPLTLPRISLWNGDAIWGKILRMNEDKAVVETSFASDLVVARDNLRVVTFPPAASSASSPERTDDALLTVGFEEDNQERQRNAEGPQP